MGPEPTLSRGRWPSGPSPGTLPRETGTKYVRNVLKDVWDTVPLKIVDAGRTGLSSWKRTQRGGARRAPPRSTGFHTR